MIDELVTGVRTCALPIDCPKALRRISDEHWRTACDTRERLELFAGQLIEQALEGVVAQLEAPGWETVKSIIENLRDVVAPRLDACGPAEMRGLLDALNEIGRAHV